MSEHESAAENVDQHANVAHELALIAEMSRHNGEHETVDSLDVYTVHDPEAFLDWAVGRDYILHGTTRLITQPFEPRQANDTVKESGNRKAVYLTKVPAFAMFKSLTGSVNGSWSTRHGAVTHIDDDSGSVSYSDMQFGASDLSLVAPEGYVYVFAAADADEHVADEYLAYKPIEPIAAVKVSREQFSYPIEQIEPIEPPPMEMPS